MVMRQIIGKQPCITFVTLGERTQWATLRQWGRRNRDALNHWLDGVFVLPYTDDGPHVGPDLRIRHPPRTSQAGQRLLDRRLRPHLRPAAKDFEDFAEHEGLTLITR
jgi:toxin FitB